MSSLTPSIRVSQHQPYPSPPTHSSLPAATPMAIPGAHDPVPPPLPPPNYLPDLSAGRDPGWQWGNDPNGYDFGRPASVKPGSSLLGGAARSPSGRRQKEHGVAARYGAGDARRLSSISAVTLGREHDMADDTFAPSERDARSSRLPPNNRLRSERQLEQGTLEQSSKSYDKQLLSRIGGPNTPMRQSVSEITQLSHAENERRQTQPRLLTMPERRYPATTAFDSPASARWPSSGAISPGFTGFWTEHGPLDSRTQPPRQGSVQFDESASHRGSYDHLMFANEDLTEDAQMSGLHIHDRSPRSDDAHLRAGSKRRASSPPRQGGRDERLSVSSTPGHAEIYHRRSMQQLATRGSPVSRFHPNHSSVSSTSSSGLRQGSLGSSLGVASIPSSATSYGSGRLSPGAPSPAVEQSFGLSCGSAKSLAANHQRNLSETAPSSRKPSTDSMARSRRNSLCQIQGMYICECCHKKPKRFDTEEELRLHESEKQYTCAYCPNRFKNKNEAERHQNSLHLKPHSWSCAPLTSVDAAFHSSSTNATDVCGYCGEEFPNPPQWDVRAEHLNHKHKFGECNVSRKFFRADHFRQHLKHSHAGTSGKWTNALENACMKDEPPPEKPATPFLAAATSSLGPPTGSIANLCQGGHTVLTETPHDA